MAKAGSAEILEELRAQIRSGALRPGERVPSTRQLIQRWGVAMATASRVLASLRQEGLVQPVPGVGTVVVDPRAPALARRRVARGRTRGGEEGELHRARIVRAAIEVADAEGVDALSMRRLGAELGVATMSLYRHVSGREELVLLMADAVLGEERFPSSAPRGWRARLELAARTQWALYQRHPWLAQVLSVTRPQLLPNALQHAEWVLSAIDGQGLSPSVRLHIHVTLFNFVRGIAATLEPEADAEQESGLTMDEWMDSQEAAYEAMVASGGYPAFSALMRSPGLDLDLETVFEFGLQRLLDGFGVLIDARGLPRR